MLRGKNILLRALEPEDVDLLYDWENDASSWKLSNTVAPFSKFVLEQYVASSHQDIYTAKQLRLMICLNDKKAIGCIDLFDFDPANQRAGVGILIADDKEKQKGYASEALELLINYSFNILHLHQLFSNVTLDNKPSLKLFQKFGFEISGCKKEWIKAGKERFDEYFLQLINKQ